MRVAIASDHGGFEQKEVLAAYLFDKGYEVSDLGPATEDAVDYPDYAQLVGDAVSDEQVDFGVLVCGTGIGMAIAANKIEGIRAANVVSPEFAHLSREHNNANVVTLSGRFVDLEVNKRILDEFLVTEFAGGRHAGRVDKIMNLENE